MTDEIPEIPEFKYGMKVCTNSEYSKRYRTQRPFVGTITRAADTRGEVKVLKNTGNTIEISGKYLRLYEREYANTR